MKSFEILKAALALSLDQKEIIFTTLDYVIRAEKKDEMAVQAELAAADQTATALVKALPAANKPGRPSDPNSARTLVSRFLVESGGAVRSTLIKMLMEKKNWTQVQATNNLCTIKHALHLHQEGYGKDPTLRLLPAEHVEAA